MAGFEVILGRESQPSPQRDITRTMPFWLMFIASTVGGISTSATTPTIPIYVSDSLGAGSELSGLLMSLSAVTSIIAMPIGGLLADRHGYRIVAMSGFLLSGIGLILLTIVPTLWSAVLSRLLFGLGNTSAMALILTWLVALAPAAQRGKALSVFGLSVWLGLAAGPQLATSVLLVADPSAVFAVCAALEATSCVLVGLFTLPARSTRPVDSPSPTARSGGVRVTWEALRSVWVPGVAAAAAWCGEGLILGFLIVHLGATGMPAAGLFSAASVFGVFAVSVIAARLVLAGMPDRIGPLRSAATSLVLLGGGLAVLAFAGSFPVAAAGAMLMGIGFSPLYPSLTMLAAKGLRPSSRALGLGLFGSFTSVGYAGGALIGGFMLALTSSTWAFVTVAGLQLVALAVITIFTPDPNPRQRRDPSDPSDPPM